MNTTYRLIRRFLASRLDGYMLNTSNPGKHQEFKSLGLNIPRTTIDLPEPNADPLTVIRFKASKAGPRIIVDDTSLDVKGADVGVNVRWLLDRLSELAGRQATVSVYLGVLEEDGQVYIYRGVVRGVLVEEPRGQGFGFDSIFQPDGTDKTLGESKPAHVNARALAVQNFMRKKPYKVLPALSGWQGPMQH